VRHFCFTSKEQGHSVLKVLFSFIKPLNFWPMLTTTECDCLYDKLHCYTNDDFTTEVLKVNTDNEFR